MRIYTNVLQAVREVERDLFEMGIRVHPQTMQDKIVADDEDFDTLEVQGYGFKLHDFAFDDDVIERTVSMIIPDDDVQSVVDYIHAEFHDRVGGVGLNPGNAWKCRRKVWDEFLHNGRFSYTYSERFAVQLPRIIGELQERPDTRQAIVTMHTNIMPTKNAKGESEVTPSQDLWNMGGHGRIPCSMYYQFMIRGGRVDLIYTMRSCDFLTHFPVDLCIALLIQKMVASQLQREVGTFTYFAGSLHAYAKDMKERGIF